MIDELKSSDDILFIDENTTAWLADALVPLAAPWTPPISSSPRSLVETQTIGATTLEEYRKYMGRRFQPVYVDQPSPDEAVEQLRGIKGAYEQHHNLFITEEAIDVCRSICPCVMLQTAIYLIRRLT